MSAPVRAFPTGAIGRPLLPVTARRQGHPTTRSDRNALDALDAGS